jgi:PPOX class probable F420-dependent enzyme
MNLPTKFQDLLSDKSKAFLFLATLMPDGSPQATPVWFNTDGECILIDTNEGRVKDKNMKARRQVALAIQDPDDRYRYIGIRSEVIGYMREGSDEHIEMLSLRYDGKAWKRRPGQKRIIFKIRPTHVHGHN